MLDALEVRKRQRVVVLFLVGVILTVFAGWRYQPGAQDFEEYCRSYLDIVENGLNKTQYSSSAGIFEPGFVFTFYVCSFISESPHWGLLVIAALAVGINLSCYRAYSPGFFLFATLFYFIHTYILRDMSLIRSGVAAAIMLYALRYVERRQVWRFLGMGLVAMSFHLASVIFLVVYPFYRLNWSRKTWTVVVICSLVIAYVMPFGRLLSSLPAVGVLSRVANYTWMIGGQSLGVLTNPTVLKQLFFVSLSLMYYETLSTKIPHFKVLLVPYVMSVCWLMVWNDFPIVSGRMATFLSVTEVLIMPLPLALVNRRSRLLMGGLLVLLAGLILYMNGNYYLSDVPGLLPYRFAPLF